MDNNSRGSFIKNIIRPLLISCSMKLFENKPSRGLKTPSAFFDILSCSQDIHLHLKTRK